MISESDDIVLARAKLTSVKIIAWACILIFLAFAIASWQQKTELWVSIGFIAFVCLGLYLLIAIGPLEVTSQSIVHNTPLAKYRIGWDVVRRIEIDPAGVGLVFIGEDKQLIVAGPGYWSAADRARMLSLLQLEVERRQIEVAQTKKAMWRLQRNTKIRKQQGST